VSTWQVAICAHQAKRLGCALQDVGVEYKGDESPLTKADTESNRVICEGLQRVSPHIPIISEETKQLPYEIRKVTCHAASIF